MFAGATREAVFSRSDVIERVSREFVPVALKAALVDNPPAGVEGRFLREIRRSRLVPQGICVANSSGKVLSWVVSFEDGKQVPKFLDHALKRYREFPDSSRPVAAERFMRFPNDRHALVEDVGVDLPSRLEHSADFCPATPPKEWGTLVAKVWGRVVGQDGKLAKDCHLQENYIEDVFDISPAIQRKVLAAVKGRKGKVQLPEELGRQIAMYSYLGQLDVRPVDPPDRTFRTRTELYDFSVHLPEDGDVERPLRVSGRTEVGAYAPENQRSLNYNHRIELKWEGWITLGTDGVSDLVLHGEGREKLLWDNPIVRVADRDAVSYLPSGKYIDIDTSVRYGIHAQPVSPDNALPKGESVQRLKQKPNPEQIRKKLQSVHQWRRRVAEKDGDVRPLEDRLRKVDQLLRGGRHAEAESILDDTLENLNKGGVPLPDEIRRRLERVHVEVKRLVDAGEGKRAEKLLDLFLETFKRGAQEPPVYPVPAQVNRSRECIGGGGCASVAE